MMGPKRYKLLLLLSILSTLLYLPSASANLFTFSSHTFTPCGATGNTGPTTASCTSAYNAATWASNASYFTTSSGIQLWTVPSTAIYRITAYGARGGFGESFGGGNGALARADFSFTQGSQLKILIGQAGVATTTRGGAGGGGGTFVTTSSNSPLVVAGGGGGGTAANSLGEKTGGPGLATTSGGAGRDGSVAGGTLGSGGASPSAGVWSGSSGGGLLGDGANGANSSTGGRSFINGGAGGNLGTNYGSAGGFGGGGGSTWGAGGGGGYSGGGSDLSSGFNSDIEGGGGGGSFSSGSNSLLTEGGNSQAMGYVVIELFVSAPDAPTVGVSTALSPTSASITFSAPANNNGGTISTYTAISTPESRTATIAQSGSGTITITGLSPNTSYVFRVYATNSYGNSSFSSPSTSITTARFPTTISIALPSNAITATFRSATTITATIVGAEGRVTFLMNSKRIAKCTNKSTTSLVATCSWLPSLHGGANISATFTPTSNAYLASSTSRMLSVTPRLNRR